MEHENVELTEDEASYMSQTLLNLLNSRGPSEEHVEVPTSDEVAPEDVVVNSSSLTLKEKLGHILHDTLNGILSKQYAVDSGEEVLALVKAVATHEQLGEYDL